MSKPSKRADIVEAAIGLLAQGGSEALSASALAERAGVSKANVFHHFPRLDELVLEAFEAFIMGMPSMRPGPDMTLRDWLTALGTETSAAIGAEPDLSGAYFGFVARARSDAGLRSRFAQIVQAAREQFETALALVAPDRFSVAERQTLAQLILLTGDGLALHRQLFPEQAEQQNAAWACFVDQICAGEARL
jgi:AcrR family transcriptional regulator